MWSRQLFLAASACVAVALTLPVNAGAAVTARYTYTPSIPVVDTPTTFNGSGSVCDKKPCSYAWQDDGPDGPGGTNTPLGTGAMLYQTFHAQGNKYIRLTVTNHKGRSSSTVRTVQVNASAAPTDGDADGVSDTQDACPTLAGLAPDGCPSPTPAFSYSPSSPVVGQQVSFDASATACYSTPCTYRWTNGTAGFATGPIATVGYQTSGSKMVTLQVTDGQNRAVSLTRTLTVGDAVSAPTLQPVDGGLGYYGQFSNPLPTSPDWYPIAVWGAYNQTQANRDLDATAGINTYVWAGDSTFMSAIRADGRFRVIQDAGTRTGVGTETAGWMMGDEWDMLTKTCPGDLSVARSALPADGRFSYMNFGKGLARPPGTSNGNWWSDEAEQSCWANGVALASVDMYWFTDPYEADFCCGYKYGDNIRNLRNADATDGQRHPNWGFVEAGDPWSAGEPSPVRSITPAEMRSAVWHNVIAGARGIIYFQHSFRGPCIGDHHVLRSNCEGTRPMATSVNGQIKQLAPVLNSPTVTSGTAVSGGIRAMVKWDGHNLYVFAGATTAATTGQVDIPCAGDATAAVLGESRSVPVTAGSLRDQFADGNAIHIYRIDGGTTCGLPAG